MYTTTVFNELSPCECARCGSPHVVHQYETTIRRYRFILIGGLHQSVKLTIPLCDDCKTLCDKRALGFFKLMKWFLISFVVVSIGLFITHSAFEAFWLSVLILVGLLVLFALLGNFIEPRLVRFSGTSIKPLKRHSR